MTCAICATSFKQRPGRGRPRRYCSSDCLAEAERRRKQRRHQAMYQPRHYTKRCVRCGKEYETGNARTRFCSADCQWRSKEQRTREDKHAYGRYLAQRRNVAHRRRTQELKGDLTTDEELALRTATTSCPLCDAPLQDGGNHPDSKHLDHIIPLAVGGTHTRTNVRIICAHCNWHRPKDGSDLRQGASQGLCESELDSRSQQFLRLAKKS